MCSPIEREGHRWEPVHHTRTVLLLDPRMGNLRERTTLCLRRCRRCGTRAWFDSAAQPFSPIFGKTYGTGYRLVHQGAPYPKRVIDHARR